MKTTRTTDNKAAITGVVTLSAGLAVITVVLVEKICHFDMNGETAPVMGALTVCYHALLNYFGVSNVPADDVSGNSNNQPEQEQKQEQKK